MQIPLAELLVTIWGAESSTPPSFHSHVEDEASHSLGQLEMWVAVGTPGFGTLLGSVV